MAWPALASAMRLRSQMEKNFDMACLWPKGIGSEEEPRFSLAEGIADFMLAINDTGEQHAKKKDTQCVVEEAEVH